MQQIFLSWHNQSEIVYFLVFVTRVRNATIDETRASAIEPRPSTSNIKLLMWIL